MFHVKSFCVASLHAILLLFAASRLLAQSIDPNVDALASKLVANASGNLPKSGGSGEQVCVVMDFLEEDGTQTRIGVQLADEFSRSLKTLVPEITVMDRSKLSDSLEAARLNTAKDLPETAAAKYAQGVGANLAVIGEIFKHPDTLEIRIRMVDARGEILAVASHAVQRDPFELSREKLPPRPKTPFPYWPDLPVAARDGFEEPHCVYCPQPGYTEAARKARIQGTMLVYLVIGPDGTVPDVVVAEGLSDGLTEKGVEAVRGWRFKPVQGPDGKPATVQMGVEITFRLL